MKNFVQYPKSGRSRWKALSTSDLQSLYKETIGRETNSIDRMYLIWKIREARKGNVVLGPEVRKKFRSETTANIATLLEGPEIPQVASDEGINYKIMRFYAPGRYHNARTMRRGLTLKQAKAHCNDPKTRKDGEWFEGFVKE